MFTPQRKALWTPTPRAHTTPLSLSRHKDASSSPPPPPPPPVSSQQQSDGGPLSEDWARFKQAGLLDEASLELKDRHALLDKLARLEKELFDYQYNMGLLLIEKNDLASKNEKLAQEISEGQAILERQRAAHLIVISDRETREDSLKKALDCEKNCTDELQKSLREMREELDEVKATSVATATDVESRIELLDKTRLELEEKSHLATAKLAEADRKTSDLNRKVQELEIRERVLQRERLTFTQEQEAHEAHSKKQKKDLLDWEKNLQEAEQRLCDSRRILNEREEKLNEFDRTSRQKEENLEELQKKIDLANDTLAKMKFDINSQSAELELKEKEAEAVRSDLEMRGKLLEEHEEYLNKRERVELRKLIDDHKAKLDAKMQECENDMVQKRTSFEDDVRSRKQELDQKEAEINHFELKLSRQEEALEKKSERIKEKEITIETHVKTLKDQEKALKVEEKRLEEEKKQLQGEEEELINVRDKLELLKNQLKEREVLIEEERKKLQDAERERSEYHRLQLNLKQEMEHVRRQTALIEREAEDLKLQRERFEKEWEVLDEKRSVIDNEVKLLNEEKESFEKMRGLEDERLKKEKAGVEGLQKKLESIKQEKESLDAIMENDRKLLVQQSDYHHNLVLQEMEQMKQNLNIDKLKRQQELEDMLLEKESAFEEMKLSEMERITLLKEDAEKKKDEIQSERHRLEKERQEMDINKKQLEETSIEISKDIETLDNLSKQLKNQREQLLRERVQFGTFIEKIKSCESCGDCARSFIHHDLQVPTLEGSSDLPEHSTLRENQSPDGINIRSSNLSMTVLRKCANTIGAGSLLGRAAEENVRTLTAAVDEAGPSAISAITSKKYQSEAEMGKTDEVLSNDKSIIDSDIRGTRESEKADYGGGRRRIEKKCGAGVRRTHSVKAVVEDAKAILGESLLGKMEEQLDDSAHADVSKLDKTLQTEILPATYARKRTRREASTTTENNEDAEQSDGRGDNVPTGGRRKRRQTVPSTLATPGQSRYNLRRHKTPETATAGQAVVGRNKNEDEGTKQAASGPDDAPVPSQSLDATVDSGRRLKVVQVSTTRRIEYSSDRIVRCKMAGNVVESNVDGAQSVDDTKLITEAKSAETTLASEEVDGVSENVEDENESSYNENNDDDGDDDGGDEGDATDYEDEDFPKSPLQKLFKFFTS